MAYTVKIDAFEGPLDLLLHLIQRLEIDIYDIPMTEITEQYMAYLHTMQSLELDVASEYLVMAASLLAIKSHMLLPKNEELWEGEEEFFHEEDPREELVERLLEYKRYKEVVKDLKDKEEERSLHFSRPPQDLSGFETETSLSVEDWHVDVYDMLGAFQKMLRRKRLQRPLATKITRQEIPIEERMADIRKRLENSATPIVFEELFSIETREQLVVTFLAVLELMKRNEISVMQTGNFEQIFVST